MVVEVEIYDQVSDRDGFHSVNSDLIKISVRRYPHSMHDLVQSSECDLKSLNVSGLARELRHFNFR